MITSNIDLDNDNFKKSYVAGSLVIDCSEIRLTQNGVAEPTVYVSTGCLYLNPSEGVEARIVCPRDTSKPKDVFLQFRKIANIKSGMFIPDSHYFTLEARDVDGRLWINPEAGVEAKEYDNSIAVEIKCDYIEWKSEVKERPALTHMVFLEELNFPKNVIQAKESMQRSGLIQKISESSSVGTVAGMEVKFNLREEQTEPKFSDFIAENKNNATLKEGFHERLLEAVRFCTATMASPVMQETYYGTTRTLELSKARPANKGLLEPPLFGHDIDIDFYRLMECYFQYACDNTQGADFSPLSKKLGSLYTLKGVWLETVALLMAVAVESILGEHYFKRIGAPSKGMIKKVDELFRWVKHAPFVECDLIQRALSSMGTMKSNRAADKLFGLREAGAISEDDRATWKRLRNPTAHGSFQISPGQYQGLLDDVYRLATLIYKLVFLQIGYSGKYKDCGTRGWPERVFDRDIYQAAIDGKLPGAVNGGAGGSGTTAGTA